MSDKKPGWKSFVVILIVVFGLVAIGFMFGYLRASHSWERKAIREGAAEWRADEDGEAIFHWRKTNE